MARTCGQTAPTAALIFITLRWNTVLTCNIRLVTWFLKVFDLVPLSVTKPRKLMAQDAYGSG